MPLKINIAYPRNGTVKQFEIDDEVIRRSNLYDHRLGNEIDGAAFGAPFKGYVFRIKGGADKDGFPMVQGVMAASRVALLIKRGAPGFNTFRGRSGERRRKNIRGCICGQDIAVLELVIVKMGEAPIAGVTDTSAPRRLGPKRASKIRKLFALGRDENVRKFVVRRKVEPKKEGKKPRFKAPKVQRLITSTVKARRVKKIKERQALLRKSQEARKEYLAKLTRDRRIHRQREASRRHVRKSSALHTIKALQATQKPKAPKVKGGKKPAAKAAAKPAAKAAVKK
jgi:small subunit ribosomal protein S6e